MTEDYDEESWVRRADNMTKRPRPYNVCPVCFESVGTKFETSLPAMPADAKPSDLLPPMVVHCTCRSGHKWQQIHT